MQRENLSPADLTLEQLARQLCTEEENLEEMLKRVRLLIWQLANG